MHQIKYLICNTVLCLTSLNCQELVLSRGQIQICVSSLLEASKQFSLNTHEHLLGSKVDTQPETCAGPKL